MLKFSFSNSKLVALAGMLGLGKRQVVSFDLPAGYTCPMASLCKAYAHKVTGKVTDGKDMKFRCYAASNEAAFTNTRLMRWANFDQLHRLDQSEMTALLLASLPAGVKVVRVHSSGDFFSKEYFLAWVEVARLRPDVTFFGYTKVLPYVKYEKSDNFHLVYSYGGKMDELVTDEPVCYVVSSVDEAVTRGLPVACQVQPSDDYTFVLSGVSFALAVHGTQPKKAV